VTNGARVPSQHHALFRGVWWSATLGLTPYRNNRTGFGVVCCSWWAVSAMPQPSARIRSTWPQAK